MFLLHKIFYCLYLHDYILSPVFFFKFLLLLYCISILPLPHDITTCKSCATFVNAPRRPLLSSWPWGAGPGDSMSPLPSVPRPRWPWAALSPAPASATRRCTRTSTLCAKGQQLPLLREHTRAWSTKSLLIVFFLFFLFFYCSNAVNLVTFKFLRCHG